MNNHPDDNEIEHPPPASITSEIFREWRSPRLGRSNPERMDNPLWQWLVESQWNAYQVNEHFKGPNPFEAGPGWCFARFGQSETSLPDGRVVLIAGEHEDHYDPDFHIYNDVVVKHPDGRIEIFGYPVEAFPPTDFHTATLVGNRIIIVGNLNYPDQRKPGTTQVATLDLSTFAISLVTTSGTPPGWISEHKATLEPDGASILVTGGKIFRDSDADPFVENIDDWRLHLADWRWERVTERKWQRWSVSRADGESLHLMQMEVLQMLNETGLDNQDDDFVKQLSSHLGKQPNFALLAELYRPKIAHEFMPEDSEESRTKRIKVNGVIVRYVMDFGSIHVTVEGDLPQATIDAIITDLRTKLSELEDSPCVTRELQL